MDWIYLSPHLDDAALSCGGLIASQTQAGSRVTILNLCAGDPPDAPFSPFAQTLHTQWALGQDAVARRRAEDRQACAILGAEAIYFSVPDCIYRRSALRGQALYDAEEAIFSPPHPEDESLTRELAQLISAELRGNARLVSPLAIGGHVDHRLARTAAEALGVPLWYYADYPYVELDSRWLNGKPGEGGPSDWTAHWFPLSDPDRARWERAVVAYRSQWPVFWSDIDSVAAALAAYAGRFDGALLWERNKSVSPAVRPSSTS